MPEKSGFARTVPSRHNNKRTRLYLEVDIFKTHSAVREVVAQVFDFNDIHGVFRRDLQDAPDSVSPIDILLLKELSP